MSIKIGPLSPHPARAVPPEIALSGDPHIILGHPVQMLSQSVGGVGLLGPPHPAQQPVVEARVGFELFTLL